MISNMKLIDKKLTLVTWGRLHKLYCFFYLTVHNRFKSVSLKWRLV